MRRRISLQQNLINHVAFVIDASASMGHLSNGVIELADKLVDTLRDQSQRTGQETRVTMYLFGEDSQAACYDVDVLRTPTIRGLYEATGAGTALIDATSKAIYDLQETATIYGDHSFLVYVLTDGNENASRIYNPYSLRELMGRLEHNWTIAGFIPDMYSRDQLVRFGFSLENTTIWDATSRQGIEEVGRVIQNSTQTYYGMRSQGVRGTSGLFQASTEGISPSTVQSSTTRLDVGRHYDSFRVDRDASIRDFVERVTGTPYRTGSAFYELTKTEEIQGGKQIMLRSKSNGSVYGGSEARNLIGLPPYTIKVAPGFSPDYTIFVQSTSVNRKLIAGTTVIVAK